MRPHLSDLLYWAACWIAVTVILLGTAAWITNSDASWAGVITFLAVAGGIWLAGRTALWLLALKRTRARRR